MTTTTSCLLRRAVPSDLLRLVSFPTQTWPDPLPGALHPHSSFHSMCLFLSLFLAQASGSNASSVLWLSLHLPWQVPLDPHHATPSSILSASQRPLPAPPLQIQLISLLPLDFQNKSSVYSLTCPYQIPTLEQTVTAFTISYLPATRFPLLFISSSPQDIDAGWSFPLNQPLL